jgi:hypothetical protein
LLLARVELKTMLRTLHNDQFTGQRRLARARRAFHQRHNVLSDDHPELLILRGLYVIDTVLPQRHEVLDSATLVGFVGRQHRVEPRLELSTDKLDELGCAR